MFVIAGACVRQVETSTWPPSAYPHVDHACLNREREQVATAPYVRSGSAARATPLREVPPNAIAGKRISGRKNIPPDDETRLAMRQARVEQTCRSFKLCLDEQGIPERIEILQGSCFPRYDAKIIEVMAQWRYSAFVLDSVAVAVCTQVTLCYSAGR